MQDEEYTPEIVSVIDDEGKEHIFEELDRIETDNGLYVALCPLPENHDEMTEEDLLYILDIIMGFLMHGFIEIFLNNKDDDEVRETIEKQLEILKKGIYKEAK